MASPRKRVSKRGVTTWAVLYRIGTGPGATQSSKTFVSEEAAEEFRSLVDILGPEKALQVLSADPAQEGITVDQLAERFFEWKARDVEDRTIVDYRRDYANWIKPRLGYRLAAHVDELDVQALVDSMRDHLEPKSVADRHAILHSMYKFGSARSRRLVDHNPCLETQLPVRKKKPPKGATIAEWQAIDRAAKVVDPDAADLLLFIVSTGWRWSEAAAVVVRGIEEYADENGVEHMYASMSQVFRKVDGKPVIVADAKSDAGVRRVKVPPTAAAMIRRRMVGKGPDDLVFTNSAGRKWYQQNFLNRTWTNILAAAGLDKQLVRDARGQLGRPTPHWLRHTHVAMLNRTKLVTMAEMQRRLGHEDIQTTINVYGGMIDDISDDALAAMDAMLAAPDGVAGQVVAGSVVLELD